MTALYVNHSDMSDLRILRVCPFAGYMQYVTLFGDKLAGTLAMCCTRLEQ
jgi:hypothetical protein